MSFVSIMLWIAIVVGMIAALAALYGRYRVLPAFLTGPAVCKLEQGGCAVLFRTKRASLLGVPNALFGVGLYVFLAAGIVAGWPNLLLLLAATAGLAMSVFLGISLIRNHLQCRICWAGHVSNALIWVALLARLITPAGSLS
jgi:uncharacterized membrane protein